MGVWAVRGVAGGQTREVGADVLRFRGERVQTVAEGGRLFVDPGDVIAGLEELRYHFAQTIGAETGFQLTEQSREFLGARRAGVIAFELGDGLFGEIERIQLVQLRAEEGRFVFGETFGRGGFARFAEQVVTQTPARSVGRQRGGQAGMQVEHLQLRLGAHQLLRLARTMEVDPQFAELLELRERGRTAVDGDTAGLGGVDRALQDEQTVIANGQVEGLQHFVEALVAGGLKFGFDRAFVGALADDRLRRAVAGEERERAEQHGLAGAGLTADDAHTTIELKLQLVDERKILNFQVN